MGYGFKRNCAHFINRHYVDYASDADHKEGMIRVSGIVWFTNIETKKRHEDIILYKKYSPEEYPHYDNYNAIEVPKVANIPSDYDGYMGVPVTFIDKYNPEQFELVGMGEDNGTGYSGGVWNGGSKSCLINGRAAFKRIFIRNRKIS